MDDTIYFDIQFKGKYRQIPLISIKPYFYNPEPFFLCGNRWVYELEINDIFKQIKYLCEKE